MAVAASRGINCDSYPVLPLPIVPCGMDDGVDHHHIVNHPKHNAVREALRVSPTHLFASMPDAVKKGVLWEKDHLLAHRQEKLPAQSGPLVFIPLFGFQQVSVHLGANHEAQFIHPVFA